MLDPLGNVEIEDLKLALKVSILATMLGALFGIISYLWIPSLRALMMLFLEYRIRKPAEVVGNDLIFIFLNNSMVMLVLAISPLAIPILVSRLDYKEKSRSRSFFGKFLEILGARIDEGNKYGYISELMHVIPIVALLVIFCILSFLLAYDTMENGLIELVNFSCAVFPHGSIEIPALLLSASLGFANIRRFLNRMKDRGELEMDEIAMSLLRDSRTLSSIIILMGLALLGSLVEVFVTPLFLAS